MTLPEAAEYLRTTPNALKLRRRRRTGPPSFLEEDTRRLLYFVADLDAYLARSARADSRSNTALSPLNKKPEPRGARAAKRPAAKACVA
ncbi:DNA-binding protein [Embleya sp. NPDC001921]